MDDLETWTKNNATRIFFDAINGTDRPMTGLEVLQQVKDNPHATDPDEPYFFTGKGNNEIGYSVQEIADILQIELENV